MASDIPDVPGWWAWDDGYNKGVSEVYAGDYSELLVDEEPGGMTVSYYPHRKWYRLHMPWDSPAAPASDKVWTPLIDGVNDDICRSLSPEVGVWVYGDGEHISLSTSQYEIFADLPDDIRLCRRTQAGRQDGE